MRRDDNQIGAFLFSGFVDRCRAVSGNGRRSDWHTIEIDALQESLHLLTTSAPRCFDIDTRIVISAARRHHHRAEVSYVKHDIRAPTSLANLTAYLRPLSQHSEKSTGTKTVRINGRARRRSELGVATAIARPAFSDAASRRSPTCFAIFIGLTDVDASDDRLH